MKIFFDALGCPKALVDAEQMCSYLENDGHQLTTTPDDADAIVINTCGFIEKAKMESIDTILSYAQKKSDNPNLKIIVSGCLTERYKEDLLKEIPEIDSAIGVRDPAKIVEAINQKCNHLLDDGEYKDISANATRKLMFSGFNYAYLKISEGCNRNCSFCAIPGIRDKERSRTIEQIIDEAKFLLEQGINEIIVIAEDITTYGIDLYGKKMIVPLLKKLATLNIIRIRLLYLFPDDEIFNIAELIAKTPNICNYIDIPLQHASENMLRAMNRPGDMQSYTKMITKIRNIAPNIAIRSAFIVGFPGETDEDYNIQRDFLKQNRLERVGFFDYSDEEGTDAFILKPKVPANTITFRIEQLYTLQNAISQEVLKRFVGKTLLCINDGIITEIDNKRYILLRTEYDAPEIDGVVYVEVNDDDSLYTDFINIKITAVHNDYDLEGEIVE